MTHQTGVGRQPVGDGGTLRKISITEDNGRNRTHEYCTHRVHLVLVGRGEHGWHEKQKTTDEQNMGHRML